MITLIHSDIAMNENYELEADWFLELATIKMKYNLTLQIVPCYND